ncbi:MAG: hypothetical protein HLUCCA11_24470 [Phormidesmis priestleyi Ana]|uniref:Uncharacterized protein n=1 Tax=Phormidesmis priestleyi Ana TaxID=1666911 RepID=A0A0P7Z8I0_9CYAN|nr:MAG: hypothetical protein HLUCCA11_24470 [Phormidesmis priestleyi Ana]
MDKLTEYISEAVKTENTEWKEIALEERKDADSCLCWCVRSINKAQPIEKILVRFDQTGPVSAEIVPAIPVIKLDDNTLTWLMSAVEFRGEDVDDVDVILTPIDGLYNFHNQKRFLKEDFLRLWPSLKLQVEAAHEVSLIFRSELFHYLSVQVGIKEYAK